MPEVLDRCPACRARLPENAVCPRCGCDFSLAQQAIEQARRLLEQALRSLALGDRAAARSQVDASLAMHRRRLGQAIKGFLDDEKSAAKSERAAPGGWSAEPGDDEALPGVVWPGEWQNLDSTVGQD
ncbi:hypothetical protein ACCAA_300027 [Candidatus Accumulibacter aalborgensis]|uniref:Uncharacterized protein n=1 Tax=Candidatus Accumulibacter aalborgensis TaxID=1860102 RepID=A0A1A8XNE3_9PROT|nr:hypothetical protein [Candidatus Accumulibacter aalborgensis]SBT06166.1 hypothetical protein ACCAA_300027 [Candidatus Accumulibacter aalborgensis]